jgi:hypothetical protein
MKRLLLFVLPLLLLTTGAYAQIEFGLKAGLSTQSLEGESFSFSREGRQDLRFALQDADYGFQFGALLRLPLSPKWTLQPEVTFNSAKTTFTLDDPDNQVSEVFDERYNDVNVPVLLSYQLAFLRLQAGPVGHFYLSDRSDLRDREGIDRTFETLTLGYALGGAIDIGPLTFDVRYDGNLANYGDTFTIRGEEIDLNQSQKRWIGTVAYRF